MGATTPAPKSHRRIAPRRPAAGSAVPRPPVAPAERVGVVHLTAEYWPFARTGGLGEAVSGLATTQARSEEHTSELQSLAYLVCRLLLEKKKKQRHSKVSQIREDYRSKTP